MTTDEKNRGVITLTNKHNAGRPPDFWAYLFAPFGTLTSQEDFTFLPLPDLRRLLESDFLVIESQLPDLHEMFQKAEARPTAKFFASFDAQYVGSNE